MVQRGPEALSGRPTCTSQCHPGAMTPFSVFIQLRSPSLLPGTPSPHPPSKGEASPAELQGSPSSGTHEGPACRVRVGQEGTVAGG